MSEIDQAVPYSAGKKMPILKALETRMEGLLESLPRTLVTLHCLKLFQIDCVHSDRREFRSIGSAPSMEMVAANDAFRKGWYFLEGSLIRNNGSRCAFLRLTPPVSRKKRLEIPIPTNRRGTLGEVVYFPHDVVAITFLPTASVGLFSLPTPLHLHRITWIESVVRRVHRVSVDFIRSRRHSGRSLVQYLNLLLHLHESYLESARLRLLRCAPPDYASFVKRVDFISDLDRRNFTKRLQELRDPPRISIVVALENTDKDLFKRSISSIFSQVYPYWELILCTAEESLLDSLIRPLFSNAHCALQIKICCAPPDSTRANLLNLALERADGRYFAEVEQHDILPDHCLLCVAETLVAGPNIDWVYTDHDEIDSKDHRHTPSFKPAWNPDLFLSANYIEHLCVFRTEIARNLGGYRQDFGGSEQFDLLLRYLRNFVRTNPFSPSRKTFFADDELACGANGFDDRTIPFLKEPSFYLPANGQAAIAHIPRILYHKQRHDDHRVAHPGMPEVPKVSDSGRRALEDYLLGTGISVEDGPMPGYYRRVYPTPINVPLVSIIIPTRDKLDLLRPCVESICNITSYPNWEILIIDNQSIEPQTKTWFQSISRDDRIRVLEYGESFNYSSINNFAVQNAKGTVLALVNNDIEVISADWLTEMVSQALRREVGIVGAKLLYSDETIQHAGIVIGAGDIASHVHRFFPDTDPGYCGRASVVQNLTAVTGACMVMRKSVYREAGGLDEHLAVSFNDIDLCLKTTALGYLTVFTPYAKLFHHESATRGQNDTLAKAELLERETAYMRERWKERLLSDPAFNPNLYHPLLSGLICS